MTDEHDILLENNLPRRAYILYVNTNNRNHAFALSVFLRLFQKYDLIELPFLVCAKPLSWEEDTIWSKLDQASLYSDRMLLLSHTSANQLRLLFSNALVVIYPSSISSKLKSVGSIMMASNRCAPCGSSHGPARGFRASFSQWVQYRTFIASLSTKALADIDATDCRQLAQTYLLGCGPESSGL